MGLQLFELKIDNFFVPFVECHLIEKSVVEIVRQLLFLLFRFIG